MRSISPPRARRSRTLACVVALCVALAASTSPSPAASTGSSVVGATILSSTSLTPGGCPARTDNVTKLGPMTVSSASITSADCQVLFGSSNDTAALRIAQVCCGTTPALAMQPDRVDETYGGGDGIAETTIPGSLTSIEAMAMRSDGRMYVVGQILTGGNELSLIARFMPDGSLDTSFNGTGYRSRDYGAGASESFLGVVVLPDGGAVAVGEATIGGQWDGTVMRVTDLGGLDGSFNGTGWATFDNAGLADRLHAVAQQPNGDIVAVGITGSGLSSQSLLVRYLIATGLTDTAGFGAPNGFVTRDFGNNDHLAAVLVEPSGRIVVGGRRQPASYDGFVAGFLADGTLDTGGFNNPTGYVNLTMEQYEEVVDIKRRPDGRFVAAVDTSAGVANNAWVAGITASGQLDTAGFNAPTGWVMFPNNIGAIMQDAKGVALLPDGRILMGGRYAATPSGVIAGRLNADGTLDTTFGTGGTATSAVANLETVTTIGVLGNAVYLAGGIAQPMGFVRWGGPAFDDYSNTGAGSDRDWSSGNGNSFFATCLRDFTGTGAAPVWTVDANTDCTNSDGDPWRAVPGTMASGSSLVGRAMTPGQDADVRLRFAARAKSDQPAGTYEAPLAFEVTAPG